MQYSFAKQKMKVMIELVLAGNYHDFFFCLQAKGKNLVKYGVGNYADETLRHEDKPKKNKCNGYIYGRLGDHVV